jgi:hypothetical protein
VVYPHHRKGRVQDVPRRRFVSVYDRTRRHSATDHRHRIAFLGDNPCLCAA